jgi:hypothetical protein
MNMEEEYDFEGGRPNPFVNRVLPPGFRTQKACRNCRHSFERREYEGEYETFCNRDNNRPLCGSVMMGEYPDPPLPDSGAPDAKAMEEYGILLNKMYGEWDAWSTPRKVEPDCICDAYDPASVPSAD